MDETPSAPGPGWYPDPNDPSTIRYWDGSQWTESRAPAKPAGEKEQQASGVVIVGYVLAVLMPIIGLIIGLTQINRSRHGIWVVVVSIVAFVVWFAVFADSGGGY